MPDPEVYQAVYRLVSLLAQRPQPLILALVAATLSYLVELTHKNDDRELSEAFKLLQRQIAKHHPRRGPAVPPTIAGAN
jgi:hypothetical protein